MLSELFRLYPHLTGVNLPGMSNQQITRLHQQKNGASRPPEIGERLIRHADFAAASHIRVIHAPWLGRISHPTADKQALFVR
jgi:hypothetical protein